MAATEIARSHEATRKHMKTLTEHSKSYQEDMNIDSIRREQERGFSNNIGKQHPRNKCPAYGSSCLKCGKANHWKAVCRSNKRIQSNQGTRPAFKKNIHTIEEKFRDDDDEVLTISTIKINAMEGVSNDTRDKAFATLEISQPGRKLKIIRSFGEK